MWRNILFDQSKDGIVVLDAYGKVLLANQRFADDLGYTMDEVRSLHAWDWDPIWSQDELSRMIRESDDPHDRFEREYRKKEGARLWVEISAIAAGDGRRFVFTCRDITARKRVEAALEQDRTFLKTLVQTLPDVIWLKDPDGIYLACNPRFERFFGAGEADIVGRTDYDFKDRELADFFLENDRAAIAAGRSITNEEMITYADDGHTELLETIKTPMFDGEGKLIGVLGVARDITPFRKTEESLRRSQANLLEAQRIARIGHYELDLLMERLHASEILREISGVDAGYGSDARAWLQLVHPEDRSALNAYLQDDLFTQKHSLDRQCRIIRPADGAVRWVHVLGNLELDAEGNLRRIIGTIQDISDHKNAENEARKLAEALRQASEGIVVIEPDGAISYSNPAFEEITGYGLDDMIGQNPRILKSGVQDGEFYDALWWTILEGKRWAGRIVNRRRDGQLFTAECSISPILDPQGNIINFVWITRDITQEIKIEERLNQAQKLEAIGTLAGGIAHDFNNILFPMIFYAEILKEDLPPGSPHLEPIDEILSATLRARDLVRQILTFSRQADREPKPLKLQDTLTDTLELLRATIPKTIDMEQHLDARCRPVIADATQVQQVIMNLATNAYHAMEDLGGTLRITVEEVHVDRNLPSDLLPGEYVRITVTDTGTGIEKSLLDRIFDPYFTTKDRSKGTGLGLSVVQGIVKSSGGEIRVNSEPGIGTEFHVYLPVAAPQGQTDPCTDTAPVQGGPERILIVDDEAIIVRVMRLVLERLGYRVTSRTSSTEALEAFTAAPNEFDMVITDMTMPKMTGDQLSQEIMKIRPDIPVIMSTGYSEIMSPETARAIGIKGFLAKPVAKAEVAATVRKALDDAKMQGADPGLPA